MRPAGEPPSTVVQTLRRRLQAFAQGGSRRGHRQGKAVLRQTDLSLPCHGLIEWLLEGPGNGGATLATWLIRQALAEQDALVVIDRRREFYPPALKLDLSQTILLHPQTEPELLWSLEQSLRCPAVGATLCWLGRIDDRAYRRLQLAAEVGGRWGHLIRPAACRRQPSWADVRVLVRPVPSEVWETVSPVHLMRVEVLSRRGGTAGETVILELCHATGDVRLASELAPPARLPQAAGA